MSRRSLGIGIGAPVSKVDCSKGGEAESSFEAKEGERGYTPRCFCKSGEVVLFVGVAGFPIWEMRKSAEVVLE